MIVKNKKIKKMKNEKKDMQITIFCIKSLQLVLTSGNKGILMKTKILIKISDFKLWNFAGWLEVEEI